MSDPDATRENTADRGDDLKARAVSETEPLLPCNSCGRIACNCPLCDHGWELTCSGGVCDKCAERETLFKIAPGYDMPHGSKTNPARYLHPASGALLDCVEVCEIVNNAHQYAAYEWTKGKREVLDAFSASAVVAIANRLNEKNRAALADKPIWKAAEISFGLINKRNKAT